MAPRKHTRLTLQQHSIGLFTAEHRRARPKGKHKSAIVRITTQSVLATYRVAGYHVFMAALYKKPERQYSQEKKNFYQFFFNLQETLALLTPRARGPLLRKTQLGPWPKLISTPITKNASGHETKRANEINTA